MSLNWDITKVENLEELKKDESFYSKLDVVIFDTMHVGIPRITKANAKEFYRRELMVRTALGNSYNQLDEFTEFISLEFIESLAGLATNASEKTITKFNKDLLANMESRIYRLTHK